MKQRKCKSLKWGKTQGISSTDHVAIKKVIKEFYKELYTHKFNELEEIDQLLQNCQLPKLNQNKIILNIWGVLYY